MRAGAVGPRRRLGGTRQRAVAASRSWGCATSRRARARMARRVFSAVSVMRPDRHSSIHVSGSCPVASRNLPRPSCTSSTSGLDGSGPRPPAAPSSARRPDAECAPTCRSELTVARAPWCSLTGCRGADQALARGGIQRLGGHIGAVGPGDRSGFRIDRHAREVGRVT